MVDRNQFCPDYSSYTYVEEGVWGGFFFFLFFSFLSFNNHEHVGLLTHVKYFILMFFRLAMHKGYLLAEGRVYA